MGIHLRQFPSCRPKPSYSQIEKNVTGGSNGLLHPVLWCLMRSHVGELQHANFSR
jgi:hypothetical protein